MTLFEKATLMCTILLLCATLAIAIYAWGQVIILRDRVDVLDDGATPPFEEEDDVPDVPESNVERREFTGASGEPRTLQFREQP